MLGFLMKRSALVIVLAMVFLEWVDFSLYLYLAKTVFSNDFFPPSSHSLMLTFALFAAAYLARPLGGWMFGRDADANGRRKPMVLSSALMGLATIGISLLPGYAVIGMSATWGLLILRMLQGLALGGEVNTSAMFMVEHHRNRPLVAGSLIAVSGALGMFAGGVFATLIQLSNMPWAWRMVFALVGVISLWVCRMRKQLAESPEFTTNHRLKTKHKWTFYWRGLINIATLAAYVSVIIYLCNVFWLSFATSIHLWTAPQCAWAGSIAQCGAVLFALPFASFFKPQWTTRLLQTSMILIAVTGPALFYFTEQKNTLGVLLALSGYALTNGLMCSCLYYFLYQQLPAQYRCQGVSTAWALAASLGAFALPVSQYITSTTQAYWFPGMLVTITALMAFIIVHFNHVAVTNKNQSYGALGAPH